MEPPLHREGKRSCLWETPLAAAQSAPGPTEAAQPLRRVLRLTERTIDKHGNPLLIPHDVLDGWTTSLPAHITAAQVIELYCQHATHEQFHAEFKTDMGLERLPSSKFDTKDRVCPMACVAMALLRLIGTHPCTASAPRCATPPSAGASARSCRRGPTRPPA